MTPTTTLPKILADQPVSSLPQQIAVAPLPVVPVKAPVPWTDLSQAAMRWLLTLHGGALVAHGVGHGSKQHIGAGALIGIATFVQSMLSKFQKAGTAAAPILREAQLVAHTVEPLLPPAYQQRTEALIQYTKTLEARIQDIEAAVQKDVAQAQAAVTTTVTATGTL